MVHEGLSVFVINLDSSKSRLEKITHELDAKGIRFERIEAVDGRLLADPAKFVSPFSRVFRAKPLSPQEIGCWLSHKQIWEEITARKIRLALVLEDDAVPRASFEELASIDLDRHALDLLRVYASGSERVAQRKRMIGTGVFIADRELFLQMAPIFSTVAYFVTLSGARKLASRKTMLAPVDWFSLRSGFDGLKHGILFPRMFDVDDGGVSTIGDHGEFSKSGIGGLARLSRRREKLVKRYLLTYFDRRHARRSASDLANRSLAD